VLFVSHVTSLAMEICGDADGFSIYHLDELNDKSNCFYSGDFINARELEDNLGIGVGILPTLAGSFLMRNFENENHIWAETILILQAQKLDRDLQVEGSTINYTRPFTNMSRFLQHNLQNYSGENVEIKN
jgi:hypothetical protein